MDDTTSVDLDVQSEVSDREVSTPVFLHRSVLYCRMLSCTPAQNSSYLFYPLLVHEISVIFIHGNADMLFNSVNEVKDCNVIHSLLHLTLSARTQFLTLHC